MCMLQTFAGQDEWMEELLGDEYYVTLFAEIADAEPITEAIDEVRQCLWAGFSFMYSNRGLGPTIAGQTALPTTCPVDLQAHQKVRDRRAAL